MQSWNRIQVVALAVLVVAGCATQDPAERSPATMDQANAMPASRLAQLEDSMAGVATKLAWSHHVFDGSAISGAWVQGNDLLITCFNGNKRSHELHCLDVQKGVPRWVVDLGAAGLKYPPMAGDRFVVGVLDGSMNMVVVNRATGAREFRMSTGVKLIPSGPAGSSESSVYMTSLSDGRVHALDPDSGMSGWHWRAPSSIIAGPVVTPRLPRRLVCVGVSGGEVAALPAQGWNETGPQGPIWTKRLLGDLGGEMAVAESTMATGHRVSLLVPCEDKGIYCLDSATGDMNWVVRTSFPFHATPQAAGGRVFARNTERLIVADLVTGQRLWNPAADGATLKPFETCTGVYASDAARAFLMCENKKVCRVDGRTGECLACVGLDAFDLLVPSGDANLMIGITRDGYIVAGK